MLSIFIFSKTIFKPTEIEAFLDKCIGRISDMNSKIKNSSSITSRSPFRSKNKSEQN